MDAEPPAETAEAPADVIAAADPSTKPDLPTDGTSSADAGGPSGKSAGEDQPVTTSATDDDVKDVAADAADSEPQPLASARSAAKNADESYAGKQTKRLIMAFAAVAACMVMVTLVIMLRRA
jgi:hypothetical protein